MKLSLSTKWFIWFSVTIAGFCLAQVLGMIWLEALELARGAGSLKEELSEIAVLASVSLCVFGLMSVGFWFISRRMIAPIREIAETADRISAGDLSERLTSGDSAEEIRSLTATLNRAFDRYNDSVKRLDKFAGNAAHQLRTPLASIRSVGEVCLQKERDPAEYRECIEDVLEIAIEMSASIEKLLTIARLNPVRVRQQFTTVFLDHVLPEVISVYDVVREEKNIRLEVSEVPHVSVMGDVNLIRQTIGNVVENAVQFTPQGGVVEVTLRQQEEGVVVQVCDTGPGMPEPAQLHGFPGNGTMPKAELSQGRMGLAIVSEIMRIHEGKVQIRQRKGGGTCVALVWPCSGQSN